jgi:PUA domain protein
MTRHNLSKKDLKVFTGKLKENNLWADFLDNAVIEVEEHKGKKCYSIGGTFIALEEEFLVPSLELINAIKPDLSSVTVDDGAVPHILNGAKLFGKGITKIGEGIKVGNLVFVKDLKGKFIAIGIAEKSSEELKISRDGAAAKILMSPGKNPCSN